MLPPLHAVCWRRWPVAWAAWKETAARHGPFPTQYLILCCPLGMWGSLCRRDYILTTLTLWTVCRQFIPATADFRERKSYFSTPRSRGIILNGWKGAGPGSSFPYPSTCRSGGCGGVSYWRIWGLCWPQSILSDYASPL